MQISRRQAPLALMALLTVSTMMIVLGDQGHAVAAKRAKRAKPTGISSLARVEILASGFKTISGVAVEASGSVLITDRAKGTLTRIDASGNRHRLLARLHKPLGVAVDSTGDLLVLDEGGGRLVRLGAGGSLSVVTSALKQARAIAVGPDGRVWVASKRLNGQRDSPDRSRKARGSEYGIARVEPSGELTTLACGFMDVTGIAADASRVYVVMRRLATERGRQRTTLALVPVGTDGKAGAVEPLLRGRSFRARGVAVDAVGNLFVSGAANTRGGKPAGTIMKRRRSGEVSTLATALDGPVAVAFAPNGDLIAAGRRVLRLKATPAPVVVTPRFTNQTSVEARGTSTHGDMVQAFWAPDLMSPVAEVTALESNGGFTLHTPLALNTENRLSFLATAAGGAALVSTPHTLLVVHDDRRPTVAITEPSADTHVRDLVVLRARGEDEDSGLAALTFMLGDTVVATIDNPDPPEPFVGTAALDTRSVTEGPHPVTVVATDRAGNTAAAAQLLVVDRTPPDAQIVNGPSGETAERTATFVVTGTDVYSPLLDFAWRLDEGAWSAFSSSTTIVLGALTPGAHTFEVKARDLAGNEDPTPGAQTFTVTALRIRITEPADGATVTTPTVWLRGTVENGGDVAVTIRLPPGMIIPSLPASTEAGTFAVEVPIDATTTTLTADAVDATTGTTATHTINVAVQPEPIVPLSGFTALPVAGLAPHVVTFNINLGEGTRVALDLDSDGTVDFDGATLEGLPFVYDRPGIYVPTLRATTTDGQVLTYRTVVDVYDRAALDARLQAVWNSFAEALQSGDVARAVGFIHGNRRAAWQEYFDQLLPDELAAEGAGFTTIALMQIGRGGAEYEMLREEDGRVFSYPIALVADVDGRWRLWQF